MPGSVASVMAWLEQEPEGDCFLDLAALTQNAEKLRGLDLLAVNQGIACLLSLVDRAVDIGERFKAQILAAQGGVPSVVKLGTQNLGVCLVYLAQLYQITAEQAEAANKAEGREQAILLRANGLKLLGEAFLLSSLCGLADRVKGLWLSAYAFYIALERELLAQPANTDVARSIVEFKRLFALTILQPEGLSPREQLWIHEYLERAAEYVALSSLQLQPEQCVFWFDPHKDASPIACIRRLPPPHGAVWFCAATPLSKHTSTHIERIELHLSQTKPDTPLRDEDWVSSGDHPLPLGLAPTEVFALLNRLRTRWAQPASREHVRRASVYSVQVCQGLRNIWSLHRTGSLAPEALTEWSVYNESAGGYGVVTVAGVEEGLSAGMVLALRRPEQEDWSICIVRWARGQESGQLELGLQMLGSGCIPISIAFRGAEPRVTIPALMLTPMPGVRNNAAILAPAGTYTSRRFVLIRDGQQLYVAQGRVLSLDMQTASVELFQYEVDPFPI